MSLGRRQYNASQDVPYSHWRAAYHDSSILGVRNAFELGMKTPAVVDAAGLLLDLRRLIQSARQRIATVSYSTQTLLCWRMGRRLLTENLQGGRAAYGKQILVTVSRELTAEYGRGFSHPEITRMIQFAQLFPDEAIVVTLSQQLSWSHVHALLPIKRKVIALLNQQKQAIIHRAATRSLDPSVPLKPSGIPWLGDIPQHWEVRRLKSLCRFVTSGSRGWARYYGDVGFVFLRIGNISTTSVDLRLKRITYVTPPAGAEGERTRAIPDDLLLSITAQIGAVGEV